jgi:Zn-dependent M28 family amino/carboxypeptidase
MTNLFRCAILLLAAITIHTGLFSQEISVDRLKKDITYLASDKLKGRGTGTKGEKKSASYIAAEFKKTGLLPKGTSGYYFPFTFKHKTDPKDSASKTITRKGKDVVGYLDNGAAMTVVIGAHYDHLGLGHDHNSLDANPQKKIHNGADDNASGVAGVLELARYYAGNGVKEKVNFLFICFSGEELGLIGSKKFCENPTIDLKTVDFMINMDMIGRLNDSTKALVIYGVGTAPDWVPMIDHMKTVFHIKKDSSGIGPSDQTSFYLKEIPVLHFFTGQHSDYHKPSDDVEKINFDGEKMVLEYITLIIEQASEKPKLVYQQTKNNDAGRHVYKVTMGVMPDYVFEGKGMRVDAVTDGKPAQKAGVQKGDVVIQLGDFPVGSTMDYMKALGNFKKGDTTTVKVQRGAEEIILNVTF